MPTQRTLMRACSALITAGLLLFHAADGLPEDKVALRTTFFSDNGGLLVRAPLFQFAKDLSTRSSLAFQYLLDRVSIPPARGISGIPLPTDGVSGASRPAASDSTAGDVDFLKNRHELLGTFRTGNFDFTGYYSTEADYTGRLVGIGYNRDFLQKNTNFAVRVAYGWDRVAPTGRDEILSKVTYLANATLTQTLSRVSIMRLGLDVAYHDGYQVNPYRTVFVNGGYFLETHPDTRLRVAGNIKLNTYFKQMDAALWLGYRLYGDDWGVISHTLSAQFYQNLSDRLLVRYRYRFYTQSAAWFYREAYSILERPQLFTADYKLMPFYGHLFGFKTEFRAPFLQRWFPFAERASLDLKYERFFTSENFGANILQVGVSINY